jgi:hypothetical protein
MIGQASGQPGFIGRILPRDLLIGFLWEKLSFVYRQIYRACDIFASVTVRSLSDFINV